MVFQKILPKHGGGGIRRFFRIRQDLFNHYMNPISIAGSSSTKTMLQQQQQQNSQAMEDYSHKYMKPLSIYDFKRKDDIADVLQTLNNGGGGGSNNSSKSNNNHNHNNNNNEKTMMMKMMKGGWRLSDDEVIQGYSRGTIDLINYHNTSNDNDGNDDDEKNNKQQQQPFIRWTGNIDTRIGTKSRAKRSGFCAIRCPEVPFGIPLSKYNALEINCRTDGRIYTVNLKVSSYFPDDLYQALITVDMSHNNSNNSNSNSEGDFLTLVLPFEDFVLTSSGLVRDTQRYLDGGVHLEHLGFTIMDGQDGPFQFDLARIRAVNYRDGIIVGDDDRQSTRRSSGNGNK